MDRFIETLEGRRLFSGAAAHSTVAHAIDSAHAHKRVPSQTTPDTTGVALTAAEVQTILAQAMSQALPTQAAVVVDREGRFLGGMIGPGVTDPTQRFAILLNATARARTVAFFQSGGEAFTTRTARFIINDHFPPGVKNTAGGPLYGVEFSDLVNSNVLVQPLLADNTLNANEQEPAISGDPGGIPLYKGAFPVGGVGVAGDFSDQAPRKDFIPFSQGVISIDANGVVTDDHYNANPSGRYYRGAEERDFDEAVALAGAQGFAAPEFLRANHIIVNGLRFPFTRDSAATAKPSMSYADLAAAGDTEMTVLASPASPFKFDFTAVPAGSSLRDGEPEIAPDMIAGVPGLIRDRSSFHPLASDPLLPDTSNPHLDPQDSDPFVPSNDPGGLTLADVNTIMFNAVRTAKTIRAGIRKPNGVHAVIHIAVVDREGHVLGTFRMQDGTNFSYDIAVQKARTAAFFSDDTHAFTPRAIGFMSQQFFPTGIDTAFHGPLYHLQNSLSLGGGVSGLVLNPNLTQLSVPLENPPPNPADQKFNLGDGITIFPGGVPLYKNGHLVGAIGVSGDGVDQDDIMAFGGTLGYRPPENIRSDHLPITQLVPFIESRLFILQNAMGDSMSAQQLAQETGFPPFDAAKAETSLLAVNKHLRLPFVKFPRNPHV